MPPPEIAPCCNTTQTIRSDAAAMDDLDRVATQTETRRPQVAETLTPRAEPRSQTVSHEASMVPPKDTFVRNENPARQMLSSQGEGRAQNPELRTAQPEVLRASLSRSSSDSAQHVPRQASNPGISRENFSNRPHISVSQTVNTNLQGSVVRQESVSVPKFSGQSASTNSNSSFSFASSASLFNQASSVPVRGSLAASNISPELTSGKASHVNAQSGTFSSLQMVNPRSAALSFIQNVSNVFAGRMFGLSSLSLGTLGFALPSHLGRGVEVRNVQPGNVRNISPAFAPVGSLQGGVSFSALSTLKRLESHMMQFARLLMGSYMLLKPGVTGVSETYLEGALYMEEEVEDREEVLSEEEISKRVQHKRDAYFGSNSQQQKG